MNLGRFRGAAIATIVLVLTVAFATWSERGGEAPERPVVDDIFRFEKEDLVGFSIRHRPDGEDLVFRRVDGEWTTEGRSWKPSRSMVRRAAHQLHDLTARANVVDEVADPSLYGLGPEAVTVELELGDGRRMSFAVGDPNPTSVSWYMRPLPAGRVYVVKKSAMDFWRSPMEDFREDRPLDFEADDVVRLIADVDGRTLEIERVGERVYRLVRPVNQPADRDAVRSMLGRLGSIRAVSFVAEGRDELAKWQLEPPLHRIEARLSSGEVLAVRLGTALPGLDPPQRYAYIEQEDEILLVRDGLLEAYQLSIDALRDRELLPLRHEWDLTTTTVERGGESLVLTRSTEEWRWPDGSLVAGATPRRVAERATGLRALAFFDDGVAPVETGFGLDPEDASVTLTFADGARVRVALGARRSVPIVEPPPPPAPGARPSAPTTRTETRQFVSVDGGVVVEVDGGLAEAVDDLFREHGRKVERDRDKHLDGVKSPD